MGRFNTISGSGSSDKVSTAILNQIHVDGVFVKVTPAGTNPNVVYRIGDGTVHAEGWDNVLDNEYLDFYISQSDIDNPDEVLLVAQNMANVITVAYNMPDINTIITNLTEILLANDSATQARLYEWEAEAERLTADSYATEAEDTFVNLVTSDGDGTFTYTPTSDYSALHYAAKAAASAITVADKLHTVSTIADMLLLDQLIYPNVNILGYTTANDGGGGLFNYDATIDKATANAGTIIDPSVSLALQGTGVGLGCWVRQYSGAVNVKWFGAKGDGSTDDTVAIRNTFLLGKETFIPKGIYLISSLIDFAQKVYGEGADGGQTEILFSGTATLNVVDFHAKISDMSFSSAVNDLVYITVSGMSYTKIDRITFTSLSGATGQIGVKFDTSVASCYFNSVDNAIFNVDYPIYTNGNNTQVFNANKIGSVATNYYQGAASAITIDNQLAADGNEFGGYFEGGVNCINVVVGAFRQNRIRITQDNMTRTLNTGVAINDTNLWEILSGGFVVGGTYPLNQLVIEPNGYLDVRHELTVGTNGGTSLVGTNTRVLNSVVANTIVGASVASNQVTLPAGRYRVKGWAVCLFGLAHATQLYNITDASIDLLGGNAYATTASTVSTNSILMGEITITGTKVFELRHYIQAAAATNGLGAAVGNAASGNEVYAQLEIWKVS